MEPISPEELTAIVGRTLDVAIGPIVDKVDGNSFELITPATGQRFGVIITELVA